MVKKFTDMNLTCTRSIREPPFASAAGCGCGRRRQGMKSPIRLPHARCRGSADAWNGRHGEKIPEPRCDVKQNLPIFTIYKFVAEDEWDLAANGEDFATRRTLAIMGRASKPFSRPDINDLYISL
jgi:hypothetical protein